MLAEVCRSGLLHMYVCSSNSSSQEPLARVKKDFFSPSSSCVFQGQFTERRDMVRLVEPVLGLYAVLLQQQGVDHLKEIRESMQEAADEFFPKTYCPDPDAAKGSINVLFGDLVEILEKQCANAPLHVLSNRPAEAAAQVLPSTISRL